MALPRCPEACDRGRRAHGGGVPGDGEGAVRARPREPVPAARGDHPVGADDRREREQGHARAVRALPDAERPRARRSRGGRAARPLDRVLPEQDEEPHRHGPGARGALRRRGADRARGPGHDPGGRAQDRQRDPLGRVRAPRPARRHPRRPAVAPAEAHERDRPGEGGARPRCDGRARGAGRARRCVSSSTGDGCATPAAPAATTACSPTSARRRSGSDVLSRVAVASSGSCSGGRRSRRLRGRGAILSLFGRSARRPGRGARCTEPLASAVSSARCWAWRWPVPSSRWRARRCRPRRPRPRPRAT